MPDNKEPTQDTDALKQGFTPKHRHLDNGSSQITGSNKQACRVRLRPLGIVFAPTSPQVSVHQRVAVNRRESAASEQLPTSHNVTHHRTYIMLLNLLVYTYALLTVSNLGLNHTQEGRMTVPSTAGLLIFESLRAKTEGLQGHSRL